ncbi:FG-GAP repeat protein [Actinomadura violacea]
MSRFGYALSFTDLDSDGKADLK